MKSRSLLLALIALTLSLGCENPQEPNALRVQSDPSEIIADGAHGGNAFYRDFFFLPPMVPLPLRNPDFELGKFNNALRPSLRIEICQLQPVWNASHTRRILPKIETECVSGNPKKTFAAGTVKLVNLPLRENGWWNLLKLPPDGFYYVLWDTRASSLSASEYYRIKVFLQGIDTPLGFADVDPMSSLRQFQSGLTGEVIQMVDDVLLPIVFRVEKSILCDGGTCNSATVTNTSTSTTHTQEVVVDVGGGSTAGASFPDGWLPSGDECPSTGPCPQSVIVNITEVNTSQSGVGLAAAAPTVCHPGLVYHQFKQCFNYTTTPTLRPINDDGDQFAEPVTVAVCFELAGTGDPREKFAELYASDPPEPAYALEDVPDGGLLGVETKDCTPPPVVTSTSSNPLVRVASAGWRKMKVGLGQLFGVKTAYAVDLGLGGIVKRFSNISPVLPGHLEVEGPTDLGTQAAGTRYILNAMAMGSNHHAGHTPAGIPKVPLTFSVASADQGTVEPHFTDVGTVTPTSVESITRNDDETRGEASAIWHLPDVPGTYHLTVTGEFTGSPATFTATVPPAISLNRLSGLWKNENQAGAGVTTLNIGVDGTAASVQAWGNCSPTDCDWGATNATTTEWTSAQHIVAFWDQGFATRTQTITFLSTTRLQVVTFTDFTPSDGRTDYTLTEFFEPAPVVSLGVLSNSWVNENQATAGISSIHIEQVGGAVAVETWGNCEPWDCPWGAANAHINTWPSDQAIVAFWDQGYATRTQTITYLSATRLRVVTFTDFQDSDPRSDYTLTEYFERPALSVLNRGWVNENAEPNITRIQTIVTGGAVSVQAWGRCIPTDCDWGVVSGNTSTWATNQQIVGVYDHGYAIRTQTITFLAIDYIKVVTFTDFTDADGRADYTSTEYFKNDT